MLHDIPEKDKVIFEEPDESGLFGVMFFAFSTVITIRAFMPTSTRDVDGLSEPRVIAQLLIDLCRRYEWLLSRTLKNSDVFRLNTAGGQVVEVDPATWKALDQGKLYSSKSEGLFDITMGSVTELWNFTTETIPEREVVTRALQHVDYHKLELSTVEEAAGIRYYAQLTDPEARVDLGGTAKGFIADALCELMKEQGVAGAFVNLGGNVALFGGKPDKTPWRIGIQSPFDPDKIRGAMSLTNGSVVTSGLYERCFTHENVFYHHILDRTTGFPVDTDIAGVSVIADSSTDADGYSTILFALGSKEAIRFVNATEGIEAIVIDKSGEERHSSKLSGYQQA